MTLVTHVPDNFSGRGIEQPQNAHGFTIALDTAEPWGGGRIEGRVEAREGRHDPRPVTVAVKCLASWLDVSPQLVGQKPFFRIDTYWELRMRSVPIWLDDEVWLERLGDRSSRRDQLAALRPEAAARAATGLRGHVRVLPLAGRRLPTTADRSRDRLAAAAPLGAENPSCRPYRDEPARTLATARVALRRGARGSRRPMLRGVRGAAPGRHAVARRDPRGGASTPRARVIRLCRSTIVRPR